MAGTGKNRGRNRRTKQRDKDWERKSRITEPGTITKFIYVGATHETPITSGNEKNKVVDHIKIPVGWTTEFISSKDFLLTYEWRVIRIAAIQSYGNICQCCGARPPEVKINVDHIKPRKNFPELCLSIINLQILCEECNHGKGNWSTKSWHK